MHDPIKNFELTIQIDKICYLRKTLKFSKQND